MVSLGSDARRDQTYQAGLDGDPDDTSDLEDDIGETTADPGELDGERLD